MKWKLHVASVLSAVILGGCGSQDKDSNDPLEKATLELKEIERRIDARTPKDQPTVELFKSAARWYKEPTLIWVECDDSAKSLL